jgi:allophanate hydrolase
MSDATETMDLAVVGAHLSNFPLNKDLTTLGAVLSKTTTTSPHYKLYSLRGTKPAKPGLVRDPQGSRIEVEIWKIPLSNVGAFLSTIPSPLGLGSVEMEDGRWVKSFICEPYGLEGAEDVTAYGGWRKYRASCS